MNEAIVLCVWALNTMVKWVEERDKKCKHFSGFHGGGGATAATWKPQPWDGKGWECERWRTFEFLPEMRRLSREGSVVNANPAVQAGVDPVLVWKQWKEYLYISSHIRYNLEKHAFIHLKQLWVQPAVFLVPPVPGGPTVLCGRGQQERDRRRWRSGGAEKWALREGRREGTVHTQNLPLAEVRASTAADTASMN